MSSASSAGRWRRPISPTSAAWTGSSKRNKQAIRTAVAASGTTVTDVYGVGPIVASFLIGYSGDMSRFATPGHYASYNGTAPIEVSSGGKKKHRLSPRGNRKLNHAIHMAAISQIRYSDTPGRVYYDKKRAEGKTKRRTPSVETTSLGHRLPTPRRRPEIRPGRHPGTSLQPAWPASHPDHRLFSSVIPGHSPTYLKARTLARPHTPENKNLTQRGYRYRAVSDGLFVRCFGSGACDRWCLPFGLIGHSERSNQVASAISTTNH